MLSIKSSIYSLFEYILSYNEILHDNMTVIHIFCQKYTKGGEGGISDLHHSCYLLICFYVWLLIKVKIILHIQTI